MPNSALKHRLYEMFRFHSDQRAREAEEAMRKMAQKAREQHRQLIRTSTSILPALKDTKATSLREAMYVLCLFIEPTLCYRFLRIINFPLEA